MEQNMGDRYRDFLKDSVRRTVDFRQTDQSRGIPAPPLQKPFGAKATTIDLVPFRKWETIREVNLVDAIRRRRSRRTFQNVPLTLEELSFLLWATQGLSVKLDEGHALRTVPSAGCRHAFETYLCVLNVEGLHKGVYRYLPLGHELLHEFSEDRLAEKTVTAVFGQPYPGEAAVTFVWTAIPYRMEWRYGPASYKVIALDAGHVCQNLYLACEALGAGTCAIAAYDQEAMDRLLRIDGKDEFTVYLAPVGKV